MEKPEKKRFRFSDAVELRRGVACGDVGSLQSILAWFGYLHGSFEPGVFCPTTEEAVRHYQRFFGLLQDGVVGPETRSLLERPRCGVPDVPVPDGSAAGAPFVLRGCKYDRNRLTFAFLNGTEDLPGSREQVIVREAFEVWSRVADLCFGEVAAEETADFRIGWFSGDHGDGASFDGPGSTLAHAFFPPPCGGPNAGEMHFDADERWLDDPASNGIVLRQVAIHEIGHLLGLAHSQDPDAIMFPFYSPDRIELADDDIQGVRALYGEPKTCQDQETLDPNVA